MSKEKPPVTNEPLKQESRFREPHYEVYEEEKINGVDIRVRSSKGQLELELPGISYMDDGRGVIRLREDPEDIETAQTEASTAFKKAKEIIRGIAEKEFGSLGAGSRETGPEEVKLSPDKVENTLRTALEEKS